MKNRSYLVSLLLVIILLPMVILLINSFSNYLTKEFSIEGYRSLLNDSKAIYALTRSLSVSLIVGLLSVLTSLYFSINWLFKIHRNYFYFILALLTLTPADVHALSIQYLLKYVFYIKNASSLGLYFALISYTFPYSSLLMIAAFSFIDERLLVAANDLGRTTSETIRFVVLPISKSAIVSAFSLSALLSFNEYTRVYYLCGSDLYLSVKIYGEMSSGISDTVNALGGTNLISSFIILITIIIVIIYTKKKAGSYR